MQCAIRETNEELHINPLNVRPAGELFHAEDMPRIHGFVSSQPATRGPQQRLMKQFRCGFKLMTFLQQNGMTTASGSKRY